MDGPTPSLPAAVTAPDVLPAALAASVPEDLASLVLDSAPGPGDAAPGADRRAGDPRRRGGLGHPGARGCADQRGITAPAAFALLSAAALEGGTTLGGMAAPVLSTSGGDGSLQA